MFLSVSLGVLVLIFVLLGQTRVRPLPRQFGGRLPIVLGVIGLFDELAYSDGHHLTAHDGWVIAALLGGAAVLGALRAVSVRVWTTNNWVLRQGTSATMLLWLLSVALLFIGNAGRVHGSSDNPGEATFLLYLALTLGVQSYVLHRRGRPRWVQLGPEAGRRLQINFGLGPNSFFTNFQPGGPGFGGGPAHDPTFIDVEVVEDDDDGPPHLRRPD